MSIYTSKRWRNDILMQQVDFWGLCFLPYVLGGYSIQAELVRWGLPQCYLLLLGTVVCPEVCAGSLH